MGRQVNYWTPLILSGLVLFFVRVDRFQLVFGPRETLTLSTLSRGPDSYSLAFVRSQPMAQGAQWDLAAWLGWNSSISQHCATSGTSFRSQTCSGCPLPGLALDAQPTLCWRTQGKSLCKYPGPCSVQFAPLYSQPHSLQPLYLLQMLLSASSARWDHFSPGARLCAAVCDPGQKAGANMGLWVFAFTQGSQACGGYCPVLGNSCLLCFVWFIAAYSGMISPGLVAPLWLEAEVRAGEFGESSQVILIDCQLLPGDPCLKTEVLKENRSCRWLPKAISARCHYYL